MRAGQLLPFLYPIVTEQDGQMLRVAIKLVDSQAARST